MKAVVLAAGYGTRFLPVTRCVPKEMLPIVDRPAIDLLVQELAEAGVTDLLVITSRRKKVLDDWFDRDPELEAVFAREGAADKLAKVRPPDLRVTFVRQQEMRGTGDAILMARDFAGDDPLIVAYPDDLFSGPNLTAQLVAAWRATGCTVLAAEDLPGQDVSRYGVLDLDPDGRVRRIVEKPARGEEPSTRISVGRYLYGPEIFPLLEAGRAAHGAGEFYPMDAINDLAARGRVVAVTAEGTRHDTGTPLGYLQTIVEIALQRDDVGPELRAWLEERLR